MELPLPKNWQDFEAIVSDALALRWSSTNLQRNGRPGQKQDGVDIYGADDIGRPVGIQCKRYKSALRMADVTSEIGKAEKFKGRLTALFLATTGDHDATLQQEVRQLSETRVAVGKFAVALLFWDDIVSGLLLNPAVLRAHYPQIALPDLQTVNKERLIAALELGYFGADLWAGIELVYGEFGEMAQQDTDEMIAKLRILERRTQQLLSPEDALPITEALTQIKNSLVETESVTDWGLAKVLAKRVSSRLHDASSLLQIDESNALEIALQLGRIYHHCHDLPSLGTRNEVALKVRAILPSSSGKRIASKFARAKKISAGYNWARRIYALVQNEIRYRL